MTCASATNSTSCFTGYYLQNVTCIAVALGTVATGNPVSTTCGSGYYGPTSSVCLICPNNANVCTATAITSCVTGYIVNSASTVGN